MARFDSDGEDIFFDACDDIRTLTVPSPPGDCGNGDNESEPNKFEYELWAGELTSIQERRQRFLKEMGFNEFRPTEVSCSHCEVEITTDISLTDLEESIVSSDYSLASSFSEDETALDGACCITDLDTGKKFMVHDDGRNAPTSMLREVGSDNLMTLQEFESLIGLSKSIQKFLRVGYVHGHAGAKSATFRAKKKNFKSLWRSFTGICKYDVHVKNSITSRPSRVRVRQQNKKCMEFSAVYMDQEIQAHKGLIRTMKFSQSGWYLGSGGEDSVVRIWQVRERETSFKSYGGEVPHECKDKSKSLKPKLPKGQRLALAIMPKKAFNISETPLHEFHGHTSDILDMAWSNSDCLLTSSKDKTVRMWKVGCDGCLAVFKHKDYVTCVQFNPVDERYFITGSIDGKIRVWDVLTKRVVDWADTWDVITALSYQPDGKGFIVGTIAGKCCFYDQSGEDMQLDRQLHVQRKKKSATNQINSLQLSKGNSPRIIITSTDSKIRVAEGVEIIQKFQGPWKSKALLSPCLTSDGRYLVSVGLDSNVYIWNFESPGNEVHRRTKSVYSHEQFFSEDVTTAIPWPGVHQGSHIKPSCLPEQTVSTPTLRPNVECCSLGTWFFADSTRLSATWPEETLPSLKPADFSQLDDRLPTTWAAWNMVIVTASRSGVIRSFHNYGLPTRW